MAFTDRVDAMDRAAQDHLGGITIEYKPAVGPPCNPVAIFDENYVLTDPTNLHVEQVVPAVWLKLEDLPKHPDDDDPVLTICGKRYTVRERQTDGAAGGGIRLLLHLVQ